MFAASGCAYAAQRTLERDLHLAGFAHSRVAGQRKRIATDGNPRLGLWWRSLRGRTDWGGHAGARAVMAARYLARAACMPVRHQRFLAFLDAHALMRACVQRDPRLRERHLHPFLHRHWRPAARLRAVQAHYRLLLRRWPEALFEGVYAHGGAVLGELAMDDGCLLRLALRPCAGREGELAIELGEVQGEPHRLVLTVIDEQTLAIGALHGPMEDGLARRLHGLPSRELLLALAYVLAGQCGLTRLLAVGDAARPPGATANLDAFWRGQDGVGEEGVGWFRLPAVPRACMEAEVGDGRHALLHRRAEWRWQAVQLLNQALRPVPWWRDTLATDEAIESPPLPEAE